MDKHGKKKVFRDNETKNKLPLMFLDFKFWR